MILEKKSDIAIIILTYNEEANIAQALDSVRGWAEQVFILDSFSTDQTVKIAENYDCAIFKSPFENYAKQRNHALEKLPIDTEWVFFLDADEWIPDDLKEEISQVSVPTRQGEIAVLPGHIPLVASLQPGVIHVRKSGGGEDIMSVSGGFIEVLKDKVVILADTAERAEELNETAIEAARKKAEETLKDLRDFDRDRFANINAQLARELARGRALKRWRNIQTKE